MFYSVMLRFYTKKDIYFRYHPGESLHGMIFNIFKSMDEKKATILHNDYQGKPFTISPVLPYLRWKNGKKYLKAGNKHFIRITFLKDEWYSLFMKYFLYNSHLQLNGVKVEVIEVLTNSEDDSRCNAIEVSKLKDCSRIKRKVKFKFHSSTTFRKEGSHIILPNPIDLFNSLLGKWKEFSDIDLKVTSDDFNKIDVSRYKLESTMEKFKDYPVKGFRGSCEYELNSDLENDKVKDINLLADFAFYCGAGYKTTMGLGQIARV